MLYLHPLILLQKNLAEPLDKELNLLVMFPVLAGQHWSLLALVVKGLSLYAVDSGHLKIYGHSDMQYAPGIGELEKVLDLNRKQLTRSPTHLDCAIQPNSFDCGYHAVLKMRSRFLITSSTPEQMVMKAQSHREYRPDYMGSSDIDTS